MDTMDMRLALDGTHDIDDAAAPWVWDISDGAFGEDWDMRHERNGVLGRERQVYSRGKLLH